MHCVIHHPRADLEDEKMVREGLLDVVKALDVSWFSLVEFML